MCCLSFTSIIGVSLRLYRVSAAQDVVQQLILRLIHFLLNCPQTQAVIQPVLVNPRLCLTRTTLKKGARHVATLYSWIYLEAIEIPFVSQRKVTGMVVALKWSQLNVFYLKGTFWLRKQLACPKTSRLSLIRFCQLSISWFNQSVNWVSPQRIVQKHHFKLCAYQRCACW